MSTPAAVKEMAADATTESDSPEQEREYQQLEAQQAGERQDKAER